MTEPKLHLVKPDSDLDYHIKEFLIAKGGKAPSTFKFYELPLRQYREFSGPDAWPPTARQINLFLAASKRRGLSKGSLAAYYRAFRTWLNWLFNQGFITANPISQVEVYEARYNLPRAPNERTLLAFFEAIRGNPEPWRRARDLALFGLLLDTGLRVGELVNILNREVDLEALEIFIPGRKEEMDRYVVLSEAAADSLAAWLRERKRLALPAGLRHLFVSWQNKTGSWGPFTDSGIRQAKDRYFEAAGLEPIRVHDLRHAYAIYTLRHGGHLLDIRDQLGHASIKTTEIYLRSETSERKKAHQGSSPLKNLFEDTD